MGTLPLILAVLLLFLLAPGRPAESARNVANTNQKGSLLVFPKINVLPDQARDTLVRISNDHPSPVYILCLWGGGTDTAFNFTLPGNASVWFRASDGAASDRLYNGVLPFPRQIDPDTGLPGSARGRLICFAADGETDNALSFNHLYGTAEILENDIVLFAYPSWNFFARGLDTGDPLSEPDELIISGDDGDFDGCPQNLYTEYQPPVPGQDESGTEVALVVCSQNLLGGGPKTVTKLLFEIFDQNGTKRGNAWKCSSGRIDSYFHQLRGGLDPWTGIPVGAYGIENFYLPGNCGLDNGLVRVSAVKSTVCETPYYYYFWRDATQSSTAPSGLPGISSRYNELGMGPKGSSQNASLLGLVVKHGPAGGQYAKPMVGGVCGPRVTCRYKPLLHPEGHTD